MGAWCARLRPSSPEGHDATRQLHAYAARTRALSLRSTVVALSGPGLHDVGADLADPRAYVALHRL
jgi:hypothetical protein